MKKWTSSLASDAMHKQLTADHSGSIDHVHLFKFDATVLDAFRQIRACVALIVAG